MPRKKSVFDKSNGSAKKGDEDDLLAGRRKRHLYGLTFFLFELEVTTLTSLICPFLSGCDMVTSGFYLKGTEMEACLGGEMLAFREI